MGHCGDRRSVWCVAAPVLSAADAHACTVILYRQHPVSQPAYPKAPDVAAGCVHSPMVFCVSMENRKADRKLEKPRKQRGSHLQIA